jgi:hypothetical protein
MFYLKNLKRNNMNIITNRPIYENPKGISENFDLEEDFFYQDDLSDYSSFDDDFSNTCGCSGCSGVDGEFSNCCGNSGFDGDYSNALGEDDKLKDYQTNIEKQGGSTSKKTSKLKSFVSKLKIPDRNTREANKTARKQRRSDRKQKRLDKKPKTNAKKLTVFRKAGGDGTERYLFDLTKLKFGKKKKKDGTLTDVPKGETATITDPTTGKTVEVDKKEISNATGIPQEKLTQKTIEKAVIVNPETKELSIEVPEKLVEMANDGEVYVSTDIQDVNEKPKDVDEKGLTKNQKIVLWSVGGVALLIVGYLVYKAVTKAPTKTI